MRSYLDNAATTKIDSKVLDAMMPYLKDNYGNASSLHAEGAASKDALEKSRELIAKSINAKPDEIYFTSGGTESNNWALKGLFHKFKDKKNHIITTQIEHDSIINTGKYLAKQGAKITYLGVDSKGFIDTKKLEDTITDKTLLVSIIHANNEIGTVQNLEAIGKICRDKNVLFHTDAAQSYTKVGIDVKKMNLSLATINSHKIHGPKGVGALYIKNGVKIESLLHGGGHEKQRRSGTENIAGIVGFSKATEILTDKDKKRIEELRDKLIDGLLEIPDSKLNGSDKENRLINNVNISFTNVEGEAVGAYLDNKGIYVSTGSACMSNTLASSHVLSAIGLSDLESNASIRFSLSKFTTAKEIEYVIKTTPSIIKKLRRLSPLLK